MDLHAGGVIREEAKRVRIEAGLTQIQLAESLGWGREAQGRVSKLETGRAGATWSAEALFRLEQVAQVEPGEVFRRVARILDKTESEGRA